MEELNLEENIWELTKQEKKEIKREVKDILKKQEKENGKDHIMQKSKTRQEKLVDFFDNIEFLSLNDVQKEEVAKKVKEDSAGDKLYWIEIFLSSTIAALWLLNSSVAVVIWAMLIAPLLRPINGMSFSVARWWQKFFAIAFRVLIFSIILSVFMWYIIWKLSGLNIETPEIIARTNPNIIDFFIAVFSAMVAVMSLRFTRLWESVAWVAMAASLMPPLAVVWIELAFGKYMSSFGAMMLFLTNLFAIILVWVIFFWLYGFTPHDTKLQSKTLRRLSVISLSILLLIIPLFLSFNNLKSSNQISLKTRDYIETAISKKTIYYEVSSIKVIENKRKNAHLVVTLKIPEWYDVNNLLYDIKLGLSENFQKKLKIDFEIIRTISVGSY